MMLHRRDLFGGTKEIDFGTGTAFAIRVPDGGLSFSFGGIFTRLSAASPIIVDWDYANKGTATDSYNVSYPTPTHNYTAAGDYVIWVSDNIKYSPLLMGKTEVIAAYRYGDSMTAANQPYNGCVNLEGTVPPWGLSITAANNTYSNCSKLTGNIPPWGQLMTTASSVFNGCTGLTGAWTDEPDELMPSRITEHFRTVFGASPSLRALFTEDWGGTRVL